MSGLKVVDDLTFTVDAVLAVRPVADDGRVHRLLPDAEAFFDDPEGFGEQPIGNGPFKADEPFVPGQGITLTRYDGLRR